MKKIVLSIIGLILGGAIMTAPILAAQPVYADGDDGCYHGALIDSCDDGKGGGIQEILKWVVRIMTVGIGILAAIGIAVSGIQYVTAGGNEERTRKSKRRIFEIVIGVFAYLLIYSVLRWLIPDFQALW